MKAKAYLLNIKAVILAVILLASNTGCNDWIDIEPENELIKQEFWKTSDDVMSVLAATYDALRGTVEKSFLLGEVRGDFVTVGGPFSDYSRIGNNDITSTNLVAKWGEYYNTINLANTVMHYAPLIQEIDKSLTDRMLESIEAEMLFVRSLCYFYVVRIWKDAPLVLEATISDTVDFYLQKNTEKEIINQLVIDLKNASAKAYTGQFSDNPEYYKGRANKYSIQALLADVLLWDERYNECVVYCDSVIASNRFTLESNSNWFDLYYPGNSMIESLFEIQYNDNLDGQHNPMYDNLLNNIGVDIAEIAFEEDIDVRQCGSKGPIWKYQGKDESGRSSQRRTGAERDANFIYYRYADILLMKAESLAELGNFEQANFLVREVAERAGVTHSTTNNLNDFRSLLLTERGREFACEGKRWFDILRFAKKDGFKDRKLLQDILLSKASDVKELAIMRTKVIDTMSYYLPIHEDELQFNRNLEQNSFYDR